MFGRESASRLGTILLTWAVIVGCSDAGHEARVRTAETAPVANVRGRVMAAPLTGADDEGTGELAEDGEHRRPVRAPISLAFAGDTSFHADPTVVDPLGAARPLLSAVDVAVINLETAVAPASVGTPPVDKRFLFRSDPSTIGFLIDAGIDAVTLANNHALDFGPSALEYGIDRLTEAGIDTVGAGTDAAEAMTPLVLLVGDWRVGMLAFSRVPCDWSWQGENLRPQVAWACPSFLDRATAAVADLSEEVDFATVLVHGGTEGLLCPDPVMTALNRRWAGAGADLVVNSHPHVVQGVTSHGETVVINSTGNFAFPPAAGLTANSAVFVATVSEQGLFVSVHPFLVPGGVVTEASPTQREAILAQVDSVSEGWRVLQDGRVIQQPEHRGACEGSVPPVAPITG